MPRLLVYAMGGGFGHLTRACALARAGRPDLEIRILTNSPYASLVRRAMPELALEIVTRDRVAELPSAEGLVVDTFPRGLVGELVDLLPAFRGIKVFVQRDLNPLYVRNYDLPAFIARSYDLVLAAGEPARCGLDVSPKTVVTAPWLIREPAGILRRDRSRALLGLDNDNPCVVVCAAGNRDELGWYGAVVAQLLASTSGCNIRCIAPACPVSCPKEYWIEYWPAIDLYAGVDVLIGGAGYNTVYEAAACGVPLVARVWPRKYDRQNVRARYAAKVVDEPKQAAAAALDLLRTAVPRERGAELENGALQAAAMIKRVLHLAGSGDIN